MTSLLPDWFIFIMAVSMDELEHIKKTANNQVSYFQNPNYNPTAEYKDFDAALFAQATARIQSWPGYKPTPTYELEDLADKAGIGELFYKHEADRFGLGSFKALGGAYAVELIARGLAEQKNQSTAKMVFATATDGNHGRSVAWGAKRIGAQARIYIHHDVSPYREKAIAAYGAEVIRVNGDYDDAVSQCREDADKNDWTVVSDTSWDGYQQIPKYVMAGYGLMIHELTGLFQDPKKRPTHIFLQGGVGAFTAAMIAAIHYQWPDYHPNFISVEPLRAPCLFESAKAGRAVKAAVEEESIMAGLSCGEASSLAWSVMGTGVSDFLLIPDAVIPASVRLLAAISPAIAAGESGVAGLAGLLAVSASDRLRSELGLNSQSRVLCFGTEGVTDPEIYDAIIERKI